MTKHTKHTDTSPTDKSAFAAVALLAALLSFSSRSKFQSKHKTFLNIFLKGIFLFFSPVFLCSFKWEVEPVVIGYLFMMFMFVLAGLFNDSKVDGNKESNKSTNSTNNLP